MSRDDYSLPWVVILTACALAIVFGVLGFGADRSL